MAAGNRILMWHTIRMAYGELADNFDVFWRIGWLWMVLHVAAQTTSIYWFDINWFWLSMLVLYLALLIPTIPVAVAWHRLIILGEYPKGLVLLRFGRRELGFLMITLGLLVVSVGPSFAIYYSSIIYAVSPGPMEALLGLSAAVALFLVGAALLWRIVLILPATAVEDREMDLGRSWAATKGNLLRLLFGTVIAILPFHVVLLVIEQFQEVALMRDASSGLQLALSALHTVVEFFALTVAVGFLSLAYRTLAPRVEAEDAALA